VAIVVQGASLTEGVERFQALAEGLSLEQGHDQIDINGPTDAIARQTVAFATKGVLVPAFAQEWCAEPD
tara:strand:+ start:2423 stop:2629 length:207 start_codon:yes stop_codon:yes gene_type:complete